MDRRLRKNGTPRLPDPRSDAATLRAFVAIARLGSVFQAADALARTQPSISARLAALEEAWGTKLFRREARGMSLTPEGARLLPLAEAALLSLEELDRTAGLPVAARHELRVGAGDALGRDLLPRLLSRLLSEDPLLEVQVLEGPGSRLVEAVRGGQIDLALAVLSEGYTPRDGLSIEVLLETRVDLLLPPGWSRRGKGAIPVALLRGERLVALQRGSGFRTHIEGAFRSQGIPFRPAVEVGNLSLVRRFVAAGLGVAPVPAVAFPPSARLAGVERRRLSGVPPVRYASVVRSGVPMASGARRLVELLRRFHGG